MAPRRTSSPCLLHTGNCININILREHDVKIYTRKEDLVRDREALKKLSNYKSEEVEKVVGIACEACMLAGRIVTAEALKTTTHGQLHGYRLQLPGHKGEWAELNGEEVSYNGPLVYSTIGFRMNENDILETLRFVLFEDELAAKRLHLTPRVTFSERGEILSGQLIALHNEPCDSSLNKPTKKSSTISKGPSQPAPIAKMIRTPAPDPIVPKASKSATSTMTGAQPDAPSPVPIMRPKNSTYKTVRSSPALASTAPSSQSPTTPKNAGSRSSSAITTDPSINENTFRHAESAKAAESAKPSPSTPNFHDRMKQCEEQEQDLKNKIEAIKEKIRLLHDKEKAVADLALEYAELQRQYGLV